MKRIYFTILSAAAALAFAACDKDTTETPDIQPAGGETIRVIASLSEQTKTEFADASGIRWQAGDALRWVGKVNGGAAEATLKAENLSADGFTGDFELNIPRADANADVQGYFIYNWHGDIEFEFTKGNSSNAARTQSEAGVMNTEYLFLHSGAAGLVTIPAGVDTYELKMDIVGTIFRVLPYTTEYNDESILSVTMMSNSDIVGTVAYDNRETGEYRAPMWQNSKEVSVTLGTPFSLDGVTDRSKSKGIYIAVPATAEGKPLDGYSFVVKTDKAEYTFNAMDKQLVVGENKVKNMFLNLTSEHRFIPLLRYEGAPGNQTLAGDAYASNSIGYTVAKVSDDGGVNWTTHETKGRDEFLYNPTFTITDAETGEAVDWVRCYLGENQICHWFVQVDKNETGKVRKAKVHAVYGEIDGYKTVGTDLQPKTYEYEITVTQNPYSTNHVLTYGGGLVHSYNVPADGCTNQTLEWWAAYVDGVLSASFPANIDFYTNATFAVYDYSNDVQGAEVDWVSCRYQHNAENVINNTHWWINAQANNTGVERKAIIVGTFADVKIDDKTYQVAEENKTRTVVLTQPAL